MWPQVCKRLRTPVVEFYFASISFILRQETFKEAFPKGTARHTTAARKFLETGRVVNRKRSCRHMVFSDDTLQDASLFPAALPKSLRKLSPQNMSCIMKQ
jgi:hypothetical protein